MKSNEVIQWYKRFKEIEEIQRFAGVISKIKITKDFATPAVCLLVSESLASSFCQLHLSRWEFSGGSTHSTGREPGTDTKHHAGGCEYVLCAQCNVMMNVFSWGNLVLTGNLSVRIMYSLCLDSMNWYPQFDMNQQLEMPIETPYNQQIAWSLIGCTPHMRHAPKLVSTSPHMTSNQMTTPSPISKPWGSMGTMGTQETEPGNSWHQTPREVTSRGDATAWSRFWRHRFYVPTGRPDGMAAPICSLNSEQTADWVWCGCGCMIMHALKIHDIWNWLSKTRTTRHCLQQRQLAKTNETNRCVLMCFGVLQQFCLSNHCLVLTSKFIIRSSIFAPSLGASYWKFCSALTDDMKN